MENEIGKAKQSIDFNKDFHDELGNIRAKYEISDEVYALLDTGKLNAEDMKILEQSRYDRAKKELTEKVHTVKNSGEYQEHKETRKQSKELVRKLMELTGKSREEAEKDVYGEVVTKNKELPFEEMEKQVLAKLPESEVKRMTAMKEQLGEAGEKAYKQAIKKLHEGKVSIDTTNKAVNFHYANKSLDRNELQVPTTSNNTIEMREYTDFEGNKVKRIEVEQGVLDNDHDNSADRKRYKEGYTIVYNALQEEAKNGKKLATYDDTFKPILDGFEGTEEEKIRAMQFLRGFVGRGIMDEKKKPNGSRSFLRCGKDNAYIWDYFNPYDYGSLILSKDC